MEDLFGNNERDYLISELKKMQEEFSGTTITRDYFREYSDISESRYKKMFGTWLEYTRAAGIKENRFQRKIDLRIARYASTDDQRIFNATKQEYFNKFTYDTPKKRFKTIIGCNDIHDIDADPFYLRVLYDTIERVKPDIVCINGDVFDSIHLSGKYNADPREASITTRFNKGLEILTDIRNATGPDKQIDFIEGNHDSRLLSLLVNKVPQVLEFLHGYHDLTLAKLFKLDTLEINYISRVDTPGFSDVQYKKLVDQENYKVYYDMFLASHIPLHSYGLPGYNGHHHSLHVDTLHNHTFQSYFWVQSGAGCKRKAVYCDGKKWNNGFPIFHLDLENKEVLLDYVHVGKSSAISGGKLYIREKDEYYI